MAYAIQSGHSWCAGNPHARWRVRNEEVTVSGNLALRVLVSLLVTHSICSTAEGTGMPTSLALSVPLAVDPLQNHISFSYSKRFSG